jgi:hypothetical protein
VHWWTGVKAVRILSPGELELYVCLFGWRFTSHMRITDFVPPGRMTLLSARSPINFSGTYRLEPANEGTGTTFMLNALVIAGSFYRLRGPLSRRCCGSRCSGGSLSSSGCWRTPQTGDT